MGSSQNVSRLDTRQQYFHLIDKRKRRYARQNSLHLSFSLLVGPTQDWKQPVLSALAGTDAECHWAYWPGDIRRLVWEWNVGKDVKWRSNVLWFDYLVASNSGFQPANANDEQSASISPLFRSNMHAKSLLDYLREHFCYKNIHSNAISALIHTFAASFERFYIDTAAKWRETEAQLAVDIVEMQDFERVAGEIKCFVEVAVVAFQSYYGGEEFGRMIKERAVDARELIIEEIMRTRVYDTMLCIYAAANHSKEAVYMQKVKEMWGLSCADLGINPLFCIDSNESAGYRPAIEALREITAATSPMSKMNIVILTTRKLCECVDEHWKESPTVAAEHLVINADQILSIFTYLVVKARVRNLMAHVAMVIEFVKQDVQHGPFGYYLATLEAAIEHVLIYPTDGSTASTNP